MKKLATTLEWLLISIALAACSLDLKLVVFNNSGETLTMQLGVARPNKRDIPTGQSQQFGFPGDFMLHISTPSCELFYQVPKTLDHYRLSAGSGVKVQIERDLSIHLLPSDATGVASVDGLASLQQDGFPLHPYSKSCRAQS